MLKRFMICALILGLGIIPSSSRATSISISVFHNDLAPYGRWITVAPYGTAWVPTHVGSGWRPYTNGYWTYTDYGWTWVSYEPFGRDVYHYGRWVYDPAMGWAWIPDTVWAPAWVAWQEGDDYVGWAPLPPAAGWGSSGLVYRTSSIQPMSWIFVERPYFLNRHLKTRVVPITRNVSVLSTTRDVTHFDVVKGKPVNRGADVARVESTNGRKMVKSYTSQRQNLRTQRRAPATQAMGAERRNNTRVVRSKETNQTAMVNRQEQTKGGDKAIQKTTNVQKKGAAKKTGKGKP